MVVQFELRDQGFFKDEDSSAARQLRETKDACGTADAVKTAESELRGEDRFLLVYGDNYYNRKLSTSSQVIGFEKIC